MRIESRRFGSLALDEKDLITFVAGLPGFPHARRFALVAHDRGADFAWLVSADEPELGFVVTDPWRFFPGYQAEAPARALQSLGATAADDLEWLVIATVAAAGTTLNLAAPLVIHPATHRAVQLILEDDTYSTREPVPALAPPADHSR